MKLSPAPVKSTGHKTPRYVAFVTEFPMNAAGKILKYKMREMAVERLKLQEDSEIVTA